MNSRLPVIFLLLLLTAACGSPSPWLRGVGDAMFPAATANQDYSASPPGLRTRAAPPPNEISPDDQLLFYTTRFGISRPYALSDIDDLFDLIESEEPQKNIVFYLHGWGAEFYSLFDTDGIARLEAATDTRFVIIRWASWQEFLSRPQERALEASAGLAAFMRAYDRYQSAGTNRFGKRRVSLLSHSMGNVVLKGLLERHHRQGSLPETLLDNLIINSADVPLRDHRRWVDDIDFARRTFIVQHDGDLVLYLSTLLMTHPNSDGPRLGAGFGAAATGFATEVSRKAVYLDLSSVKAFSHRHFQIARSGHDNRVGRLYARLLNGGSIEFPDETIGLVERHATLPIFFFQREAMDHALLLEGNDR